MITLALECATHTAGMAILDQKRVLAELDLDVGGGHSRVLLPALDSLLALTGLTIGQIDLLAATTGPGSFTGVRIGVGTIKGLALSTGKPVVGVSTLAALSLSLPSPVGLICPLLDARKGQVYAGLYRIGADGLPEAVVPDRLTDIGRLVQSLPAETIEWVGETALLAQRPDLNGRGPGGVPSTWRNGRLSASAVALIALGMYHKGKTVDPLTFAPSYLRPSEAEQREGQQR